MCTLKCHFALVDKLHWLQLTFSSFSRTVLMCFLRSSYSGKILITISAFRNIIFTMDCCVMGLKIIFLGCDVVTIDTFRNISFYMNYFHMYFRSFFWGA